MLDWSVNLAVNAGLVGVLGYFLKKVDKKIDTTAEKLEGIGDKIVEKFDDICKERQSGCSKIQDVKVHSVCNKLEKLEEQRREDWREQKLWNARMEERVTKGGAR